MFRCAILTVYKRFGQKMSKLVSLLAIVRVDLHQHYLHRHLANCTYIKVIILSCVG